jgi:DNA helicase-2/ATP-dependent DNA helicase PcrA
MKRDIPYEYRGGKKFFDRAHVKDVLAFLKILANREDLVAWMRILGLQVGIGAVSSGKIYAAIQGAGPLEDLKEDSMAHLGKRVQKGWSDFMGILRGLLLAGDSPSLAIDSVITSDYAKYLEAQYPNWRDRLEDLRELASFSERYDDIHAFLSDVSLEDALTAGAKDTPGRIEDEDRIVLTTIHQAKGLEWDAVFVMHMSQGQFPNRRAVAERDGMEEERRLFYVAVTRARRDLYLCHPVAVGYGSMDFASKSEFLDELPAHLVEDVAIEEDYDSLPSVDLTDDDSDWRKGDSNFLIDLDDL